MATSSLESPFQSTKAQILILMIGLSLTVLAPLDIIGTGFKINLRTFLEIFFGPFLLLWSLQKIREEMNIKLPIKMLATAWSVIFFVIGILGITSTVLGVIVLGVQGDIITVFLLVYGSILFLVAWREELSSKLESKYLVETPTWKICIIVLPVFLTVYLITFILNFIHLGLPAIGIEIIAMMIRNSLFTGSIYLLLGIGLSLIYKILDFPNFSHGELLVFGPYISIFTIPPLMVFLSSIDIMVYLTSSLGQLLSPFIIILETLFSSLVGLFGYIDNLLGMNVLSQLGIKSVFDASLVFFPVLGLYLVIAFFSSAILALIVDVLVFRPLRARKATPMTLMIASIGVSFVIRFLIADVYSSSRQVLAIEGQPDLNGVKLIVIVLGIIFFILLDTIVTRTKLGKAMRAMADNTDLAQASGISKVLIIVVVWLIGAGFAGMGGVLRFWANTPLSPSKGFILILPTFAVVILGGIGSIRGTFVAAYIVGIAENFGTFILTQLRSSIAEIVLDIPIILGDFSPAVFKIEPSLSGEYQIAMGFIILVIALLIKPSGLFGEELAKER